MRDRSHMNQQLPVIALVLLALIGSPPGCRRDGQGGQPQTQSDVQDSSETGAVDDAPSESGRDANRDGSTQEASTEPAVPPEPPELDPESPCIEPDEVALFVSPRRPMADGPLRIMIVSEEDIPGAHLWARSPEGVVQSVETRRFYGPPHAWSANLENLEGGTWRIALSTGEQIHTCEDVTMRTVRPSRRVRDQVWPVRYTWDRRFENLYSAWIMQLFETVPDERPSWSPLHEVLRDPERNWLYNRLGLNEDGPNHRNAVRATPDCADTPYYLRAYFAWKMRLLFVFSACNRGRGGSQPTCHGMFSNLDPPEAGLREAGALQPDASITEETSYISEVTAFDEFMNRVVVATVQSGAGRTLPDDSRADLYPIELSRESIRPGTIFVDPYGHLLVVSQWVDQTDDSAGMLFAIDGHPDLSIGRKRFWRGAFLFLDDLSWGAGGFKAFRPVFVRRRGQDDIRRLSNSEIDAHEDYGNYSDEQYQLGTDGFYERMDRVINPNQLNPSEAQRATLEAFYELVQERIDSVRAGEDYMTRRGFDPIDMPEGSEIFETSGAWEDFSTPARDLRILIAMDLVTRFPDRVVTSPEAFLMPEGQAPATVASQLRSEAEEYLGSHHVTYRRSNGTEQLLTLATVLARRVELEMAYNPNDCIEIRWGAPEGNTERATCSRHAPEEQLDRMRSYRTWFHTRTRPPRR